MPLVAFLLSAEHLTVASFLLLSEDDLRELGFPLGPRKLLMKYISSSQQTTVTSAVSVTVSSQQLNATSTLSADVILQPSERAINSSNCPHSIMVS
jgi:hypothetical protein